MSSAFQYYCYHSCLYEILIIKFDNSVLEYLIVEFFYINNKDTCFKRQSSVRRTILREPILGYPPRSILSSDQRPSENYPPLPPSVLCQSPNRSLQQKSILCELIGYNEISKHAILYCLLVTKNIELCTAFSHII